MHYVIMRLVPRKEKDPHALHECMHEYRWSGVGFKGVIAPWLFVGVRREPRPLACTKAAAHLKKTRVQTFLGSVFKMS